MKTLILCGGKGTRAYPQSLEMPKPLMTVGDSPILLHLMEIFARQGFTEVVISVYHLVTYIAPKEGVRKFGASY